MPHPNLLNKLMQRIRSFSLFLLCSLIDQRGMRIASASSLLPLSRVRFGGRILYIKRDDQRAIQGEVITGNKGRKLQHLSQTRPFPNILASYGGAQSNSMLALAQLIHSVSPSTQFYYFTKPLPSFLRDRPNGNLAVALQQGMTLVEIDNKTYDEFPRFPKISAPFPSLAKKLLFHYQQRQSLTSATINEAVTPLSYYWVPQGAAMIEAEVGVQTLINELMTELSRIETTATTATASKKWKIVIASGTGTMALFAARHLAKLITQSTTAATTACATVPSSSTSSLSSSGDYPHPLLTSVTPADIEIVAIPCAGDAAALRFEMQALASVLTDSDGLDDCAFPTILGDNSERNENNNAFATSTPSSSTSTETENTITTTGSKGSGSDRTLPQGTRAKWQFGTPCPSHLRIWQQLQVETGIVFDLLYAPRAFEILLHSFENNKEYWDDCNVLYYHCGGVEGNESLLGRYKLFQVDSPCIHAHQAVLAALSSVFRAMLSRHEGSMPPHPHRRDMVMGWWVDGMPRSSPQCEKSTTVLGLLNYCSRSGSQAPQTATIT